MVGWSGQGHKWSYPAPIGQPSGASVAYLLVLTLEEDEEEEEGEGQTDRSWTVVSEE